MTRTFFRELLIAVAFFLLAAGLLGHAKASQFQFEHPTPDEEYKYLNHEDEEPLHTCHVETVTRFGDGGPIMDVVQVCN